MINPPASFYYSGGFQHQGATVLGGKVTKALAGIGKLPDTVSDRSTKIILQRRSSIEPIERFRRKHAEKDASVLRQKVIQLASQLALNDSEPVIPEELDDRAADCWEPLLAIADAIGGNWPSRARKAAIELFSGKEIQDESTGIKLLADIHNILADIEVISSTDLAKKLGDIEESSWSISAKGLAVLLKPYGIRPATIRIDDKTPKGYKRSQFKDAFIRYIPYSSNLSATSATLASKDELVEANGDLQQIRVKTLNVADDSQERASFVVADVADSLKEKGDSQQIAVAQKPGFMVEL